MTSTPTLTKAKFIKQPCATPCTDPTKIVDVHFNPVSLQYTIVNTMSSQGNSARGRQHVSQSSGKLTMDLVFDSTHTGEDVRIDTKKIAKFMDPEDEVPPVVKFKWGTFIFQGMAEKYKETIDFFSASGVPLRASINLTMASQDTVFPLEASGDEADDAAQASRDQVNLKPPKPPVVGGGGIGGGAGPSAGSGAGAGIGASAGVSVGIGAGVNVSGSAGVGASMSAGVSASNGAFSGLRTSISAPMKTSSLNVVAGGSLSQNLGVGANASFGVGGQAQMKGDLSMKADVGTSGALQSKIQFDGG